MTKLEYARGNASCTRRPFSPVHFLSLRLRWRRGEPPLRVPPYPNLQSQQDSLELLRLAPLLRLNPRLHSQPLQSLRHESLW